jgi:hypothetical protein
LNDPASSSRIQKLVDSYKPSLNLELQQRACEYSALLTQVSDAIRPDILEHIPPRELDEDERRNRTSRAESSESTESKSAEATPNLISMITPSSSSPAPDLLSGLLGGPSPAPSPSAPAGGDLLSGLLGGPVTPAPSPAPAGGDLLSGLLGGPSITPTPTPAPSPQNPLASLLGGPAPIQSPSPVNPLANLLGGPSQPPNQMAVPANNMSAMPVPVSNIMTPQNMPDNVVQIPPMVIYEKSGIKVTCNFLKQPQTPNITLINISITNATPVVLNNFTFQVAVPNVILLYYLTLL